MENKKTFGAYILQRRRELGMTQKELARELYVTESAVSKWERGLSYPDITLVQNICSVLQVTEHELLSGSEDTSRRISEKLAEKYRKLTRNYRMSQYIIYGLILLGCAVGNLAAQHRLDWFFIVVCAVMMAASLTLVPALAALDARLENYKLPLSLGAFLAALELLLLVCCIYTGGDWFLMAGISVLFGTALVFLPFLLPLLPLPESMADKKASVYLLSVTGLLLLLLLVSCIYTGGTWFPMAAVSVLFGLGFFLLPVILHQTLRGRLLYRHKALLYFSVETVLLFMILLTDGVQNGMRNLAVSFPVAVLCLILPWGIMGVVRYLPANGWLKGSAVSAFTGLWIWMAPWILEQILSSVYGQSNDPYRLLLPFDFSAWDVVHTPWNVIMVILIVLGIAAVFCLGMGLRSFIFRRK